MTFRECTDLIKSDYQRIAVHEGKMRIGGDCPIIKITHILLL